MSLPKHFLSSLQQAKGVDIAAFEETHHKQEQITSVRINTLKQQKSSTNIIESFGCSTEKVAWCNDGFYLQQRPSFTQNPFLHAGAFYVQEASSMFLQTIMQQIFENNTQQKVLDVCAAPGGKTTLLANFFKEGLVVSNEVIKTRAGILVENCIKWGTENIIVTNNDPKDFSTLPNFFDALVIDAPCSGSGMFRKDETALHEWSLENVTLCSQRQKRILADVMDCLKEQGFIIYSTCSYSVEENEDIVDWMMNEFDVQTIKINLQQSWNIVETESDKHKGFGYRFYPDKIKGEGFFVAVLQKKNVTKTQNKKTKNLPNASNQEISLFQQHIEHIDQLQVFKNNQAFRVIKKIHFNTLEVLANNLYIKKAGIGLGEIKGKDFIPSHELAVSMLQLVNFATISFNIEDALRYLKKKELNVQADKGWILVTYFSLPLGWMKVLPNRINNYYPQEWRILKD